MSPARRTAWFAAALAALGAAGWGAAQTWLEVRPELPMQVLETKSLRLSYPAGWEASDPSDPRLGDKELVLSSPPQAEGPAWQRLRMRLVLREEGAGFASLAEFTAWLRRDEGTRGPEQEWLLANGVQARTWVESEPLGDIPARMRWAAFQGRDGRYYSAGFLLPAGWRARLRCRHLFRVVLGSMEFKLPASDR